MSPTRREFIAATAVGTAGVLALPGILRIAPGHAPAPGTVDELPQIAGLPSKTRIHDLWCRECGESLGLAIVDELDDPAAVACHDCFKDKVEELEDQVGSDDYDSSDLEGDLEEARDQAEKYEELHKRMEQAFDSLTTQYLRLRLDTPAYHHAGIQMDRLRESLDDLQRLFNETI